MIHDLRFGCGLAGFAALGNIWVTWNPKGCNTKSGANGRAKSHCPFNGSSDRLCRSAGEPREAYGVRPACWRFRATHRAPKREQAPRTPGASRHSVAALPATPRCTILSSPITKPQSLIASRAIASGFSLIELLVAVGLMSLIVLGLLVMFQQTQRAFTGSMTQVDMLEGARATTDLIERELEQMTPSHTPYAANFISELAPPTQNVTPAVSFQDLPGTGSPPLRRINVLHHFFFLTRENQTWRGIGYLVGPPALGVGTLYRFSQETNSSVETLRTNFDFIASQLYRNRVTTNLLTRMVDGVVHLRVRAYNTNGFLIVSNVLSEPFVQVKWDPRPPISGTEVDYYFWSNAVPAYVELEIGFLEDRAVGRFKSLGSPSATSANAVQQQYLTNHVGQVHLFRRRVAIRDVDTLAYK